ncbi:non-ribosomal peptide synthetase, partial [Pseudomonas sp. NBRC 111119]|uniref:non-ribosomal peptide synthetase n=1 Tax=Pseudomonas sp. NBRC 111119 TaxID=1661034 RepID=UPI000AA9893D
QYQTVQSLARVATLVKQALIDQGVSNGTTALLPFQHLFFASRIPERQRWNQSLLLSASTPIDPVKLNLALRAVVRHHDALRLTFHKGDDGWQGTYLEPGTMNELLWLADNCDEATLQARCDQAQGSLSLEQGPLMRALLATMEDGSQRLLLVVHHLVVDGVSWRILLDDLQQAYQQLEAGRAVELPAKTHAFKAWAEHLATLAATPQLLEQLPYWQATLAGASHDLPCDHPDGALQNRYLATVQSRLDKGLTRQLLQFAPAAYRTQVNDLLLTALARVMCRWAGTDSTVILLEGHGRETHGSDLDLSRSVGWFTSLFPVRLTPQPELGSSLKTIKEHLRAVPQNGLGYGVLRHLAADDVSAGLVGLAQPRITFNYLGQFDSQFDDAALFVPAREPSGAEQSPLAPLGNWLTINGQVYDAQLSLEWNFSSQMFETATLQRLADAYTAELTALVTHCCDASHAGVTPSDFPLAGLSQRQLDSLPFAAARIEDIYPLSPMQQGMMFHTLFDQQGNDYINQLRVDVQGLDRLRFEAAWQATVLAHDTLRSAFIWQGDVARPVQVVLRDAQLPVTYLDWADHSDLEQSLPGLAEAQRTRSFVLDQAPLMSLCLVRTGDDTHHVIFTNHHILLDGWSNAQLFGEVLQRYRGEAVPAGVGRYRDYIAWLQARDMHASEAFWKAHLADLDEPTRLAQSLVRGEQGNLQGHGELVHLLDAECTQALNHFAREQKVTINTLVQAAWLVLLQRYTGQGTVAFGATVSGRPSALPGIEQQVGLFINTLPVIAGYQPGQSVSEWLQAVQALNLGLREHEHTPLFDIQRWAGQQGEALFDSILVFENYPLSDALQGGEHRGPRFGHVHTLEQTSYPLTLGVNLGETLSLHYGYARAHFSDAAIYRINAQLLQLFSQFTQDAQRPLGALDILLPPEWQALHGLNAPHPYPVEPYVHQRIAEHAACTPDRTAVIFDDQVFSYGQIDTRANRLAHALMAQGVGPEVRVAVALPRNEQMIVALLAVLKAGAAYVPLDASYPRERLAYLLQDCGATLVLSDRSLSQQLPLDGLPLLETDCIDLATWPAHAPVVALHPHNIAYVIYTSGSTGQPKGVCVAHGPISMHCQAIGERYAMTEDDCELHFMSFAFDGAHERWLTLLTHGGRLLMRDDNLWTTEQTYAAMHAHGVTVAAFPPVYLQQLAEHAERDGNPPATRIYCFGGDAVPAASFELAKRALRPEHIINGYGPTETVVTPLIWKADRSHCCGAAYAPIGSRVGDRSTYVLAADLSPLPRGVAGELFIGGSGLARGYLNRPSLTAERFVPHPYGGHGQRLYRSGDLVRVREDDTTDYIGRIDHQVKIRGFRIELGEIEACLQQVDGVREAVALAHEGPRGQQLVAYLTPRDPQALELPGQPLREAAREHLRQMLPGYMVPAHVHLLGQLPLTPNGKLDRKALPRPESTNDRLDQVAPRNEIEAGLAEVWQEVLRLETVGITDNFFELGGDSIISIQLVSRARLAGIHFTPKELFRHQTIQALATVARAGVQGESKAYGPAVGDTPLLPVQQVFFEWPMAERGHWNQSVLLKAQVPLEGALVRSALLQLVEHHDALRLAFTPAGDGWQASYQPLATLQQQWADRPLLWEVQVEDQQALEAICDQAQRSLDLSAGVVMRAVLATLADGSQRLLLLAHHLVVDGVSWRILLEDLQAVYRTLSAGHTVQLPARTSALKDWAQRLHGHAQQQADQGELDFWQAHLANAEADLPCDNPEGSLRSGNANTVESRLTAELTRKLLQVAPAAYRTQVNDLLLTALARVICTWTGCSGSLLQIEGHGREDLFDDIDLTRTVGWFTSLFPVYLQPADTLEASIKAIKEQLRAIPDKGLGYGALRYLGGGPSRVALAAQPTGRITFNYLGQFDGSFDEAEGALFVPAHEAAGAEHGEDAPLGNWLTLNGQVYGGQLTVDWRFSTSMFHTQTVQALAEAFEQELTTLIEHCCDSAHHGATPSDFPLAQLPQPVLDTLQLRITEVEDIYPLSPMQQGMLFHTLYQQDSGDYINQMRLDVEGLEPERFRLAWQAALANHEVLRSGFLWEGELATPLQVVFKQARLPFTVKDWRMQADQAVALDQLAMALRSAGFQLAQAPLLDLHVVRVAVNRYHLIFTSHHLLMDGWSSSQLLGEVLQHYAGQRVNSRSGRYSDYIAWLQQQDMAASETFWRAQLGELQEPTRLAAALGRERQPQSAGYDDLFLTLDAQRTRLMSDFAKASKVTLNSVVQAAWLLLLQRHIGHATVAFGATVSGRPAELKGIEQQIGLFINTLPVIATPQAQMTVEHWLQTVQAQNVALREHEHTPLAEIQRWAGMSGEALFDTILVFENYPVSQALEDSAPGELRFGEVHTHERTNFPLTLLVNVGEQLTFQFSYNRLHFSNVGIDALAEALRTLLHNLCVSAQRPLGEVGLISPAAGEQQL